mgnify:CR=1 FL=1
MDWLNSVTGFFSSPTPLQNPQSPATPSLYNPEAQLSQSYRLKDLVKTTQSLSSPNLPTEALHFTNLSHLAEALEVFGHEIGPFQIISAYRTKELQQKLGASGDPVASGTSFHELGRGVDIYPTTMSLDEYFGRMLVNENVKSLLAEVAYKPGQKSIHIGINVPGDVRETKVLSLNQNNVYARLTSSEIARFIEPYMESLDAAYDYAAARLVTWNKTPLILAMVAATGGLLYLILKKAPAQRANPRFRTKRFTVSAYKEDMKTWSDAKLREYISEAERTLQLAPQMVPKNQRRRFKRIVASAYEELTRRKK